MCFPPKFYRVQLHLTLFFAALLLLFGKPPHTKLISRERQREDLCCFLPSQHTLAVSGTPTQASWWQCKSLSAVTFEEGVN